MYHLCINIIYFQPEGIHGLREELVERGVPHAVDRPLDAVAHGWVAVLGDHWLPRLAVDVGEAEHGVSGKLRTVIVGEITC